MYILSIQLDTNMNLNNNLNLIEIFVYKCKALSNIWKYSYFQELLLSQLTSKLTGGLN